jgi:hypothetical protein
MLLHADADALMLIDAADADADAGCRIFHLFHRTPIFSIYRPTQLRILMHRDRLILLAICHLPLCHSKHLRIMTGTYAIHLPDLIYLTN